MPFETFITWNVMSAQCARVSLNFLKKYEWGKGQTGGINCSSSFVLTAFTILSQFNNFWLLTGEEGASVDR